MSLKVYKASRQGQTRMVRAFSREAVEKKLPGWKVEEATFQEIQAYKAADDKIVTVAQLR